MTSRVSWQARKELERLPRRIAGTVLDELENIDARPVYPHSHVKHLEGNTYRLRVGDYRVVFDKVGGDIVVREVGHRQEVFRQWRSSNR